MVRSMSKRNSVLSLIMGLLLLVALSTLVRGQQLVRERDWALVERACAGCHAVTITGQSPHTMAPPFRDLSKKYPIEHLAESAGKQVV